MSDPMTPEAQIAMLESKVTELVERNRKLANQIVGYGDRMQQTIAGIVKTAKVEALREAATAWAESAGLEQFLIDDIRDDVSAVRAAAEWLNTRADNLEAS